MQMKTFAYADKLREKQRQDASAHRQKSIDDERKRYKPKQQEAWSDQKARKEKKVLRREKKTRKHDFLARQRQTQQDSQEASPQANDISSGDDADDWAEEERQAKRQKKVASSTSMAFQDM